MSSQRHACVPKHTAILQNRVPASNMNNRASAIVFAYLHDACWSSWRRSERVTVTAMLLNSAQSWIYAGLTLVDDLGHFAVIFWRVFGFDAHRKWSSTRVCVGCQRKNWRWTVETPAGCSLRKFLVRDRVSRITYTSTACELNGAAVYSKTSSPMTIQTGIRSSSIKMSDSNQKQEMELVSKQDWQRVIKGTTLNTHESCQCITLKNWSYHYSYGTHVLQ